MVKDTTKLAAAFNTFGVVFLDQKKNPITIEWQNYCFVHCSSVLSQFGYGYDSTKI